MSYPKLTPIIAKGATEPRYLEDRFADCVNVVDYGAKGDSTTDCASSFIAAKIEAGTKPLFIPDGIYKITASSENLEACLSACSKLVGSGSIDLTVPAGFHNIEEISIETSDSVGFKLSGSSTTNITLSNTAVTFSGSAGYYIATMTVPDGTLFSVGTVFGIYQNANYNTQNSILNGCFRVLSVSGNNITFPVHYHTAAYALSSMSYSGTIRIYNTVFKQSGSSTCLTVNHKSAGSFQIINIGISGSKTYGSTISNTVAGFSLSGSVRLVHTGITECGYAYSIDGKGIVLYGACVANCYRGLSCEQRCEVKIQSYFASCLCEGDSVFIEKASNAYSECKMFVSGNAKRGIWCYSGSSFLSTKEVYAMYNAQAGVYAKLNASIIVGNNSEASYNLTTDANDCPGYGCEADASIIAMSSTAKYNGSGYMAGSACVIDASSSTANNNRDINFYTIFGCIECANVKSSYAPQGIACAEGGLIRFKNAEIHHCTTGVVLQTGSCVRGDNASVHDNTTGISTQNLCEVNAPGLTFNDNTTDVETGRNSTVYAGSTLYPSYFTPGEGHLYPTKDDTYKCGLAGSRWSNIYASTGSVQTSDRREKTSFEEPSEALIEAWSKVGFKVFQFIDAIDKKGADKARLHVGFVSQDVQEAFSSSGLDAERYGVFCYDEWDDMYETVKLDNGTEAKALTVRAGNRYGIRYDEALVLECAYLRSRISKMQEQINTLTQLVNQLTNNNNNN